MRSPGQLVEESPKGTDPGTIFMFLALSRDYRIAFPNFFLLLQVQSFLQCSSSQVIWEQVGQVVKAGEVEEEEV